MNAEEYILLYEKYISGLCSPEEEQRLYAYQDDFKLLNQDASVLNEEEAQQKNNIYARIDQSLQKPKAKLFRLNAMFKAAALLLLTGALSLIVFHFPGTKLKDTMQTAGTGGVKSSIKAGRNRATLTLSDGSLVNLDDVKNGMISTKDNALIRKSADGAIAYSPQQHTTSGNATNTITVPRGGNYKVTLPDGTLVWLNSASSLTYPLEFTGKYRNVELQGEAYFEVTKNKHKPFTVTADKMQVAVLGTHFNVSAYGNASAPNTTLFEGSVRLSHLSQSVLLVPGQQGTLNAGQHFDVAKVNLNKVMAWKNGYFLFQDDSVREIMEQISRWYDVDIEYRGDMSNKTFGGIYSRNKDLDELLKGLELTGLVHFKIEGRRIIVMA